MQLDTCSHVGISTPAVCCCRYVSMYKFTSYSHCSSCIQTACYDVFYLIFIHGSALKSTENCVCILHNLSYQIEAELPKTYANDLRESRQNLAPKPKAVGCFSYRSAQITEVIPLENNLLWQYKKCTNLVIFEIDSLWKHAAFLQVWSAVKKHLRRQTYLS